MAIKQTNAVADQAAATATVTHTQETVVEVTREELTRSADVVEQPRAADSAAVLDEPEAEPEEAKPAASSTTAVATASVTPLATAPVHRSGFLQQIMDDLAEEGFEGTELDYSSFLNVTLNKQIETSEGHELPNSGFLVRLASARKKYCFRNNNPVEEEVEVAYSYDINAPQDPESAVAKAIAKWKEEGLDLAPGKDGVKVYVEVLAQILDDKMEGEKAGELNGKLITIQVAPTSNGRWGGYLTQLKLAKKNIADVVTLVRRGKKVESGKFPFYPWDFVMKGKVSDLLGEDEAA